MLIDGPTFVFRFWLAYIRELASGWRPTFWEGGLIVGVHLVVLISRFCMYG